MNIIRKTVHSIYLKRRKIVSIAVILVLIPMFQNCGGGYTSRSVSLLGSDSSSSTADGSPAAPSTPGMILPLADLQKLCKSTTTTPDILSSSLSEVTIKSGLGDNVSGDASSAAIHIVANRGIKDIATFSANTCDSQYALNLSCSIVTDDATRPITITNAFDMSGNNLLKPTPAKSVTDLAKGSILTMSCNALFGAGKDAIDVTIAPNTKMNAERCVEGSFWMKLGLNNQVSGIAGMYSSPSFKYVKVNMANGCWVESRLKDSAGNLGSVINFGTDVSISNGWAASLAPTDDAGATVDVGSVYMYKLEGSSWVQKEKIMIADAAARESINSVAIHGDTMVLGSPYRSSVGSAFFYRRSGDTWNLISRVSAPDSSQLYQDFGFSVAVNDNYVFVSSPSYAVSGMSKAGSVAVYSYTNSGMTYIKSINGSVASAAFGYALATEGSTLAVGAPQAIGKENLAPGSVYIFTEAGGAWSSVAAGSKVGANAAEKFGSTIDLLGTKLLVGSPNFTNGAQTSIGRVAYYADYTAAATKVWNGPANSANLGQGLALSSTGVYVGVPMANTRAGYVDYYLYSNLGTVYYRIQAYNATSNSAFGWSVAASGNDVIVGARIKNDPNDNSGAAYIYRYK